MTSLLHTPSALSPSFISLAQVSSLVFPNSFSGWGPLSQLALLSKFRFTSKSSLQGEGGWEGAGKHLPCPALPPPSLTAYLVPGEPAAGDPIWGKPTPAHSSQERVDVGEKLGVLPASVPTTYSGQGGGSRFGLLLFWWLRRRRRQENSQSRLSPKPAAQSREGPPDPRSAGSHFPSFKAAADGLSRSCPCTPTPSQRFLPHPEAPAPSESLE